MTPEFTTEEEQDEQRSQETLRKGEKKDHSFDLVYGLLVDLKESFGRVDERTKALQDNMRTVQEDIRTVRTDLKGTADKQTVWTVCAIIIAVVLGVGTLIYQTVQTHSHPHTAVPPPPKGP